MPNPVHRVTSPRPNGRPAARPASRPTSRVAVALLALLSVVAAVLLPAGGASAASTRARTAAPVAATSAAGSCGWANAKLLPACGVWWGVWPRTTATGTITNNLPANVASLEGAIGRKVDIVSRYKGWGEDTYDAWDAGFRDSGHIILEDLTARNFKTNTYTPWADIAAGKHDAYLKAQAARAKAFRAKTFFSFNQEPEQALERGNVAGSPAEFAAAYRHVHDVFVAAGATNVVWVWWVMGYSGHNAVYPQLWPGSAYVDWISYDPYDFNACHKTTSKTPVQTIAPWYGWVTTRAWATGKPLMLSEYGTNGLDKGAWLAGVPAVLKGLPKIRAAVQFNSHPGSCDHRVTGSADNLAGFKAASADRYVNPHSTSATTGARVSAPRLAAAAAVLSGGR